MAETTSGPPDNVVIGTRVALWQRGMVAVCALHASEDERYPLSFSDDTLEFASYRYYKEFLARNAMDK